MMRANTGQFMNVFEEFWRFVAQAEKEIRTNGHHRRLAPCCHGDPWDEDFAAAYLATNPHLKKFRRKRFYSVPMGLAFRSGPFTAENAHQALMFFLNPPRELCGEKEVLDSPEYKTIKAAAMHELQNRDQARVEKVTKRSTVSVDHRILSEIIELRAFVLDHHFPKGSPFRRSTLTSTDIQRKFGWSQSTESRRMAAFFKSDNGREVYVAIFGSHTTPRGYRKRFDDGTLDVEAVWTDRKPCENDDDPDAMLIPV